MKPIVIYHKNCTDGFGAAFCAWQRFRKDGADYVPMNYGEPLDISQIAGREVYLLDFSFPHDTMLAILQNASALVWRDHHETAFRMWTGKYEKGQRFESRSDIVDIILDDNRSGAWLAWEYFNEGNRKKQVPPTLIMLIDDRDRWAFKMTKSKEAHAALMSMRPWSFYQWSTLSIPDLLDLGDKLITYERAQIDNAVRNARPIKLAGVKGLAVNSSVHPSEIGHELAKISGTFGCVWSVDADMIVWVSLRGIDDGPAVSDIATHYGGGGHRNAAGFKTTLTVLLNAS